MKKWLIKYSMWLLAGISLGLAGVSVYQDNLMALVAFFTMFVFAMVSGVYFANMDFARELLTEYDNLVRAQQKRKGLKVIPGGKKK